MYLYAADLLSTLRRVWNETKLYVQEEATPPLPDDRTLRRILDVAYHASLLTEERRRPSFRIVCCPRSEVDTPANLRLRSSVKLSFAEPVPFNEKHLLQLAPATNPTSVLIAVEPRSGDHPVGRLQDVSGELQIWGLLDTGSSWWAHVRSESERAVQVPPDYLMVSSARPGQLVISRGWRILLRLENGRLSSPPIDVFVNSPIADDFHAPVEALFEQIYAGAPPLDPNDPYEALLNRHNCSVKYTTCVKRLLTYLMDRAHGGMLVLIPDGSENTPLFRELVAIKYCCGQYEAWTKLLACLSLRRRWFEIGSAIVRGGPQVDRNLVVELSRLRTNVEEREHELTDGLQLMAALSGVDGAVIVTDRLRLIGFGAELCGRKQVPLVYRATDARGEEREPTKPESFGTRHRSAFRFVAEFAQGTAFVHSQDGGVKAVKRLADDIVYWDVSPPND